MRPYLATVSYHRQSTYTVSADFESRKAPLVIQSSAIFVGLDDLGSPSR